MRTIEISTEVFAKIWSQRISGEESENVILMRLLGIRKGELPDTRSSIVKILWRQDVRTALLGLGGTAQLNQLYDRVREIRRERGSSVPENLKAIVRKELEYNSSDATSFQGKHDWFRSVDGIGSGHWAAREDPKS